MEKVYGDLNNDSIDDCVMLIKEYNAKCEQCKAQTNDTLDLNRRGYIILFKKDSIYELALKNYRFLPSRDEDRSFLYMPPELYTEIKNNILYINISLLKYGFINYKFRYKNADFELIGCEVSQSNGPVEDKLISYNFLTKKKIERVNINKNAESGKEVFKETWKNIIIDKLIKLSEIKYLNELDMDKY